MWNGRTDSRTLVYHNTSRLKDGRIKTYKPHSVPFPVLTFVCREIQIFFLHSVPIYKYLCNQCLSPLTLWVQIPLSKGVVDTTLCDKVCQWLATGQWFSPGTSVSSINKTYLHNIIWISLKVALNIITLTILYPFLFWHLFVENFTNFFLCDCKLQSLPYRY